MSNIWYYIPLNNINESLFCVLIIKNKQIIYVKKLLVIAILN